MKQHQSSSSLTPWLASGLGLLVGLMCLLLGAGEGFGAWLSEGYQGNGFPELSELSMGSPAALLALVIFTVGGVFAIGGTPGTGRRAMLLLSGLVVLAMASPVMALWGVFWNPLVLLVSVSWAGLGALVHGHSQDRAHALRIANERNVVSINPARSPRQEERDSERKL